MGSHSEETSIGLGGPSISSGSHEGYVRQPFDNFSLCFSMFGKHCINVLSVGGNVIQRLPSSTTARVSMFPSPTDFMYSVVNLKYFCL